MSPTQTISLFVASIALLSTRAPGQLRSAPSHSFDLIHISLELTIDYPDLTFEGVVTNTVIPAEALQSITLHVGKNLDVRSCDSTSRPKPDSSRGRKQRLWCATATATTRRAAVSIGCVRHGPKPSTRDSIPAKPASGCRHGMSRTILRPATSWSTFLRSGTS